MALQFAIDSGATVNEKAVFFDKRPIFSGVHNGVKLFLKTIYLYSLIKQL